MYFVAFAVGLAWPRRFIAAFVLVNVVILAQGIDFLLVLSESHLRGTWFNKNVQGAQFLLLVPVMGAWTLQRTRWSPYFGFVLGALLFYATLTQAMASQILIVAGLVAIVVLFHGTWNGSGGRRIAIVTLAMACAGSMLAWSTIRPDSVQIFGQGFGGSTAVTLEKANTTESLGHRVEMLRYTIDTALAAAPWGTGIGSTRDLYPWMKAAPGVNVPDVHNYYAQVFMTLGPIGLLLLAATIGVPLLVGLRRRAWIVFVPAFLFAGYLAFDVAGYFPGIMILFFGLLGANVSWNDADATECRTRSSLVVPATRVLLIIVAVVGTGAWAWWTQPCEEPACLLGRRLGNEATARRVLPNVSDSEAPQVTAALVDLSPRALWTHEFHANALMRAGATQRELAVRRDTAHAFPVAHNGVYLAWRDAALRAGDFEQASEAYRTGGRFYHALGRGAPSGGSRPPTLSDH